MKLLFLDVDGVLNSHQSIRASYRHGFKGSGRSMPFCPISCSNLDEVLARVPDLYIVVSSTWRIGRTMDELKKDLEPSLIDRDRIIGVTPTHYGRGFSSPERGHEIQAYLDMRKERGWEEVTEFVILDDNSDMAHLMPHLVQTDGRLGFMWDKAVEVLKRFGQTEYEGGMHTLI